MRRILPALLLAIVLAGPSRADQANCSLVLRASLPMDIDETGRITVPVTFNGVAKRLLVDTGTPVSMITAQTAKELHLIPQPAPDGRYFQGMGGTVRSEMVRIAEFGFGDLTMKDAGLFVETSGMDSAGLLGADIMNSYDMDFDFAHAKLNFFSPDHCEGQGAYWTRLLYRIVPFQFEAGHIKVRVRLDEQDVWAILDTGAPDTVMSLERTAHLFAVDPDALGKKQHYPFQTLFFGGVNVLHPSITLVPDEQSALLADPNMNMIIGMTVLRRLHLYISYKEKMIYATPASQY